MNEHPYIRYAQALLMVENNLSSINEITLEHIKNEIEKGLNSFRVRPSGSIAGKSKVQYVFDRIEKGDTKKEFFFLPIRFQVISKQGIFGGELQNFYREWIMTNVVIYQKIQK